MGVLKKWISVVCAAAVVCCAFLFHARAQGALTPEVVTVDIDISSSDYKALISKAEKIEYNVSVSEDQSAYNAAAINIRGNSSRYLGLVTSAKRIPFELTYADARPFGGINNKSIKFINSISPYRLVSEYLGLELFSYAGIPTPAHSFAFIRFNDVDFGLYIAVEDVNKTFLSKWYEKPLASAFKATTNEEKSAEFIDSEWFGHLFKKVSGKSDHLDALIDALNKGEGYEQYINVDEWLRYFACVAVTGGQGSIFTEKNNFVLYESNGKYELIPWDLSEAFSGKSTRDGIDRYYFGKDDDSTNPLFDLIMRSQSNKEKYHAYIRELNEGFLSPAALGARYNAILDAIAPYLPRDHSMLLNSEDTIAELRSDSPDVYLNLRYMLHAFYLNVNAQLDGSGDPYVENEHFSDFYAAEDDYRSFLSDIEADSPLLDRNLPKTIAKQAKKGQTDPRSVVWLMGIAAAACAVLCLALYLITRKKAQTAAFFKRHAFVWKLLLFLIPYEWIFARLMKNMIVSEYVYSYHALDFRVGFCTKILPGAIVNFLFKKINYFNVSVFETVLMVLFFVALAFLLEKFYLRFSQAEKPYALLLIFLFVTGPCSFGIFVRELGMLDAHWLYLATIILFLLSEKKLWPLIVVFGAVMILVYYSAIICFAPFVVILLLLKAAMQTNKKDKTALIVLAAVFSAVTVGETLYFLNYELANLKLSSDAFTAFMNSQGVSDTQAFLGFWYGIPTEGMDYEGLVPYTRDTGIWDLILQRVLLHKSVFNEDSKTKYMDALAALVIVLPVLLKMQAFFIKMIKTTKQRFAKFVYFCMFMLFFFTNGVSFFVSTDTVKWLAIAFMLTFACFLASLYYEPQELSVQVVPWVRRFPAAAWVCYCVMYAVMVFHPY